MFWRTIFTGIRKKEGNVFWKIEWTECRAVYWLFKACDAAGAGYDDGGRDRWGRNQDKASGFILWKVYINSCDGK